MKILIDLQHLSDTQKLLWSFVPRRVVLASQVALLLEWDPQKARRLLREGCEIDPPWFKTISLSSKRGHPSHVYLLTDIGSDVLSQHLGIKVRAPQVADSVELRHAVTEVELFILAHKSGISAEIEKVYAYGDDRNIRIDVALELGLREIWFEVEQAADLVNLERILGKLNHLGNLFRSGQYPGVETKIRIIFSISPKDTKTIKIWERALYIMNQEWGKKPRFSIWWMRLDEFQKNPNWNDTNGFRHLRAVKPQPASEPPESDHANGPGGDLNEDPLDVIENFYNQAGDDVFSRLSPVVEREWINTVWEMFGEQLSNLEVAQTISVDVFFDLVETIYACSQPIYKDWRVETVPYGRIAALKAYLERPKQALLRKNLIQTLKVVDQSYYRGLNMVVAALTRLVWDVFLRHHGIARGGTLKVMVSGPEPEVWRSDFHVKVVFNSDALSFYEKARYYEADKKEMENTKKAIAWVLEALWLYRDDLGLSEPKKSKRGK